MPQAVTIRSLPRAFELVKGMRAQGLEWGEGYRGLGRAAIAAILAGQMGHAIDEHLDRMAALDQADRRNGSYRRHLLTELGEIELAVPRTRRFAPIAVVRAYARRAEQLDRMILACFRSRALGAQGGRGAAADLGTADQPGNGEHGGQAARRGGCRLPYPRAQGALPGADARWRRPGAQDRPHVKPVAEGPRRDPTARPGRSWPASGRQEGDHRFPPGAERERRRMGALPR